uniref:Uncharacterized protein n=1 Tax=Populus alba TaxID=43335 RepID=A0A4V6ACA4_POPAL|nr:hypothetical protein D5086_0000035520 [Populus alba]
MDDHRAPLEMALDLWVSPWGFFAAGGRFADVAGGRRWIAPSLTVELWFGHRWGRKPKGEQPLPVGKETNPTDPSWEEAAAVFNREREASAEGRRLGLWRKK